MVKETLLLILGVAMLTGGAECLVRGAVALASRLGVSSFFIGLTLVGFGTSTPELATSIQAALNGLADVNLGNVVGSNIFNLALILGVASLIMPIPVDTQVVRREVLTVIAVAFLPFTALISGGFITPFHGVGFLLLLAAYLYFGYRRGTQEKPELAAQLSGEVLPPPQHAPVLPNVLFVIAGLVLLVFGARFLVESSIAIARAVGISELVISLTIVAGGTSAPELFTSVVAALRKQPDVSVGNVLGSNVFNMIGIVGVTSLVAPQHVSPQILWYDGPVMVLVSLATLPIMMTAARISRREGILLLGAYLLYLAGLFTLVPQWFQAA